jgi:hypothetical protein
MAQVLAVGAGDDPALVNRSLVRTLAALPDGWTLLVDRCIGGVCAGYIEAVLVHAEIGVAVIDEAPGDAFLARATLCRLLQRERFSDYYPGDLPVVAVGATVEPPAVIGEQLAAAFDAAPRLSIADPDWAYAVIELILQSGRLDVAVEEEAVETVCTEPVFCREGTIRISSRTAGSAEAGLERGITVGDARSPHKVQLVPLVAVWLLGACGAARAPARRRWIRAVKWAGLAGAIVAVTWGFGYRLEYTPRLKVVTSPPEVETMAGSPPAVMESVTLPRAASQDKARRSAKGPAASAAVTRSAPITRRRVECADWLHQNRPGGSDYHGPPVAGCSRRR